MSKNLFFNAAKNKYRYSYVNGSLTTEQLFDLPLTSKTGADLNTVAKSINSQIKALGEEDFVGGGINSAQTGRLNEQLDIVKLVIADKQAALAAVAEARANKDRRAKLLEALEAKDGEAISSLSREDILKELAAIGG